MAFGLVGTSLRRESATGEILAVYRQVVREGVSTTALSDSVVPELLKAFRAGDGVDLVRESPRMVMQELIGTEAAERVGPGRDERTNMRVADRNGSRL